MQLAIWREDRNYLVAVERGPMMPSQSSMRANLQHELLERTPEAGQSCASLKPELIVVDHAAADATEGEQEQPPLYASGIPWIDRAYNVIRQLRRDHGLADIRPLTEPPLQSDSAAIETSSDGPGPARRQPPQHRKGSSIQPG